MDPTSLSTIVEKREKALTWLWRAFWAKWILTTILGIFFFIELMPCIRKLSDDPKSLWALVIEQTIISCVVFVLALFIFKFLLKCIREGKFWPVYVLGMYEILLIFILGIKTMGYSYDPSEGLDVIEFLAAQECNVIPNLYIALRFAISVIMAFTCVGAYACFILFRYPLEKPSETDNLN